MSGIPWAVVNFGLRYDLRCPDFAGVTSETLARVAVEQSAWADERGFLSVTLSEHHGSPDAYLPSPMVLGAAIAARTQRIRLVLAALIVPLHDPVRLAEDIAMLDVVSGGRVVPVLSAGYVENEFRTFGRELSQRAAVMEAIVPFLKKAFSGEAFEHRGVSVRVLPRPVQRPHPPIVLGGASAAAARRAARHADHFIPSLQKYWDVYREERIRLGRSDPGPGTRTTGNAIFVAEDPDAAWARIAPHALHETRAYAAWAKDAGLETGYVDAESEEALRERGDYPVLTPEQLIERARGLGAGTTLMLHPLVGGLDPDFSWAMLELFEKRVMPAFRDVSAAGESDGG